MKNKLAIKINGSNSAILSVTFKDILNQLDRGSDFKWALLWIQAIGNLGEDMSILDLEKEVNDSEYGIRIDWEALKNLSNKLEQVIELVLIGNRQVEKLKKYKSDQEMYATCDYTIELIDSSYWIIHSVNSEMLTNMKDVLPGVEYINW